jgi:Right handed beta helix region
MKLPILCLLALTSLPLLAQNSLTVTTNLDNRVSNDNLTSLREAVDFAQLLGGPQTITFNTFSVGPIGTVDFDAGPQTIMMNVSSVGEIAITKAITIIGPGADLLTIDAFNGSRIFNFSGDTPKRLSGMRLHRGGISNAPGGAIDMVGGSLTLDQCAITDSVTQEDNGGGIAVLVGTLTLNRCTLSGNSAAGVTQNFGGAIYAVNSAVQLTQCTFYNNFAAGNNSEGGGVYTAAGFFITTLNVNQCTFSENKVFGTGSKGGGISSANTNLGISNTIIANSTGGDVFLSTAFPVTLGLTGRNLIEDASIPAGSSVIAGDPLLGVFGNHGGRTETLPLQTGSSAINAGVDSVISLDTFDMDADGNTTEPIPYDQRGFGPRSRDGTVDIGATEFGATGAEAPRLIVTTTSDVTNAFDFQTSLREAMRYAETVRGNKLISFSNNSIDGAVNFHSAGSRTITLSQGQLAIGLTSNSFNQKYIIEGPGPDKLIISANQASRVLQIGSSDQVAISGLTLTNGKQTNDPGGAILCRPSQRLNLSRCNLINSSATAGGGIYFDIGINVVTLDQCNISGNTARSAGGGIHIVGLDDRQLIDADDRTLLSMERCTISGNTANGGAGIYARNHSGTFSRCTISGNVSGSGQNGGGISWDDFLSQVTLEQCTISGNTATPSGSFGSGGGIYCGNSSISLVHCTVNNNTANATKGGGIHVQDSGRVALSNTIVANSNGLDTFGIGTSNLIGKNLVEDNSLIDPFYIINGDPRLGSLANNGGITLTHALFSDSPAINTGDDVQTIGILTDARGSGFPRISGLRVDIGAYEFPSPVSNASALSSWRTLHNLAADGSQDLENPSGDGVKNLLKFAFNLAPNAGNLNSSNVMILPENGTAGLPRIFRDNQGQLVISFLRRKSTTNSGVSYTVETGVDLVTFTPLNLSSATIVSIDTVWERITVADPTITTKRFGRVKISSI